MILVTDHMFPTKYSKWRIEGLKAFVDVGADILVDKVDSYAGVNYHVNYDEMCHYYNLNDYNIFIFDKKYNNLNVYNTRLDGTAFNGKFSSYSYMFSRHNTHDISRYDKIYHMFLSGYNKFNRVATDSSAEQTIHLYPGGTFNSVTDLRSITPSAKVISTHPLTSRLLKDVNHNNFIECFGSTCLPKTHSVRSKTKNADGKLRICFSNMGAAESKGALTYFNIMNACRDAQHIEWYYVGVLPDRKLPPGMIHREPMSQSQLDDFYYNNIDILLNMEDGSLFNGWPLGIEAALQGVVLISTDVHSANKYFKYNDNQMCIVGRHDTFKIIKKIKQLYSDRNLLHRMSTSIQEHSVYHFSYDKQQGKILNYMDIYE